MYADNPVNLESGIWNLESQIQSQKDLNASVLTVLPQFSTLPDALDNQSSYLRH